MQIELSEEQEREVQRLLAKRDRVPPEEPSARVPENGGVGEVAPPPRFKGAPPSSPAAPSVAPPPPPPA